MIRTEEIRYWNAIQVMARKAIRQWIDVEKYYQNSENGGKHYQASNNLNPFSPFVKIAESDVWQEHKGEKQARQKSKDMCKVVYPRQHSKKE